MPNASADPLLTRQRFITQTRYVNPMMTPDNQPSAGPTPINVNNRWTGPFVFPQMAQQNHQATGFQQGQMQLGFQNQGPVNQPMNLVQPVGGQQTMANAMFPGDRAPQRHMEAYE